MMETPEVSDELRELGRDVVALKVSNAQLAVTVVGLTGEVVELKRATAELTATLNRGKGALWGLMLIAGAVGGLLPPVIKGLLGAFGR
jgi:hypothetical protein